MDPDSHQQRVSAFERLLMIGGDERTLSLGEDIYVLQRLPGGYAIFLGDEEYASIHMNSQGGELQNNTNLDVDQLLVKLRAQATRDEFLPIFLDTSKVTILHPNFGNIEVSRTLDEKIQIQLIDLHAWLVFGPSGSVDYNPLQLDTEKTSSEILASWRISMIQEFLGDQSRASLDVSDRIPLTVTRDNLGAYTIVTPKGRPVVIEGSGQLAANPNCIDIDYFISLLASRPGSFGESAA